MKLSDLIHKLNRLDGRFECSPEVAVELVVDSNSLSIGLVIDEELSWEKQMELYNSIDGCYSCFRNGATYAHLGLVDGQDGHIQSMFELRYGHTWGKDYYDDETINELVSEYEKFVKELLKWIEAPKDYAPKHLEPSKDQKEVKKHPEQTTLKEISCLP